MISTIRLIFTALAVMSVLTYVNCRAAVQSDIEYGKAGGVSLKLDVSVPDGNGPYPVAIIVHGGGWGSGSKSGDITPLLKPLSDAKFTWFSIDYRLAPQNRWPACLDDVQTAIRWVKAHASQYKGDPRRIALIGYSAGGQLVCQAATTADRDTRVDAVVACAAPTDLVVDTARRGGLSKSLKALLNRENDDAATEAILREMSPINHVHPGLPPFLLIQGTSDKTVPYSQSVNFQAKLQQANVACKLIAIPEGTHTIALWQTLAPDYQDQMIAWLNGTLSQDRK